MMSRSIECFGGACDLWQIDLARPGADFEQLLSDEERLYASSLADEMRAKFSAVRGCVREILSRYTDAEPSQLRFDRTANGKPFLRGFPVQFNVSHKNGRALVSVSRRLPVGVDLEKIRTVRWDLSIAQRYFSLQESESLRNAAPNTRTRLFLVYWTLREALSKASGLGLVALSQMRHLVFSDKINRDEFTMEFARGCWRLCCVDSVDEYVAAAAIAVE